MSDNNIECYGELVSEVLTAISQVYWGRMYKYIKDNNIDYKDVNCFILNPESMAVYFSKTFIAIWRHDYTVCMMKLRAWKTV